MKIQNNRRYDQIHMFTLIELVVVITIIAIIATLMIPVISGLVDDAESATETYNSAGVKRMLETYYSANGRYPSGMHTGMSDDGKTTVRMVDTITSTEIANQPAMSTTMDNNFTKNTIQLPTEGGYRLSLMKAGLCQPAYGYNGGLVNVTGGTDYLGNKVTVPVRAIKGDWKLSTGENTVVRGQTFGNWTQWNTDDNTAYMHYVPLFITRMTQWGKVLNDDGSFLKKSSIAISSPPTSAKNNDVKFNYFIAIFLAYNDGRAAELFSVLTPEGEDVDKILW